MIQNDRCGAIAHIIHGMCCQVNCRWWIGMLLTWFVYLLNMLPDAAEKIKGKPDSISWSWFKSILKSIVVYNLHVNITFHLAAVHSSVTQAWLHSFRKDGGLVLRCLTKKLENNFMESDKVCQNFTEQLLKEGHAMEALSLWFWIAHLSYLDFRQVRERYVYISIYTVHYYTWNSKPLIALSISQAK